jgi:hypothetical protein
LLILSLTSGNEKQEPPKPNNDFQLNISVLAVETVGCFSEKEGMTGNSNFSKLEIGKIVCQGVNKLVAFKSYSLQSLLTVFLKAKKVP